MKKLFTQIFKSSPYTYVRTSGRKEHFANESTILYTIRGMLRGHRLQPPRTKPYRCSVLGTSPRRDCGNLKTTR